jgi:5'-3' exonuclease
VTKLLICDGYNLMHRARSGFALGPAPVMFNFFRGFKSLIEQHNPSRVVFVLDGCPKKRLESLPTYKLNRVIDPKDDKKLDEMRRFHAQKDVIIELLRDRFPVSVVKHADYEADDVIYTLVKNASRAINVTVVSSDSDFTQLLDEFDNVTLHNPVKKTNVQRHSSGDYVLWKSLRGDPTDNIDGFDGIGDVKAAKMVDKPEELEQFLREDVTRIDKLELNMSLVKLEALSEDDYASLQSSEPTRDWENVKSVFTSYGFKSMINDSYWAKFVSTFDSLWCTDEQR